jgi:rhodanese-related sulfurtransferase
VLLDVRTAAEVATGRIAGALTIPVDELEARWSELERCDEVVCYCASGGRSRRAAELLRARGLFNATSMTGGVAAWTAAGGALVRG